MKIAIVGLRESFYALMQRYFEAHGVKIIAVMGGRECEERAEEVSKSFGATHVESVKEIIAQKPDAILQAGWYSDRPSQIISFLEAGIPVFSTKVLAADYQETMRVIETAKRTNVVLMSGSTYRHCPVVLQAADAIKACEWGKPAYLRMIMPHDTGKAEDRRDCGGMLTHYAAHPLSAMVGIVGSNVERVSAFGGIFNHDDLTTEDTVMVSVQFANDAIAHAEVLCCQNPTYPATVPELDIHCTKKSVRVGFPEGLFSDWYGKPVLNREAYDYCNGYNKWMKVFLDAIKQGQPPVPYDEYIEVAAALHMGRISRDENRTVHRSELNM